MTIEEKIFAQRVPIRAKLLEYGFSLKKGRYTYQVPILNGQFLVTVVVDKNQIASKVVDVETGEEYVLVHLEQQGTFTGEVRSAYQKVLKRIAAQCFEKQPFKTAQANRIARKAAQEFNEQVDFPFTRLPTYGVLRNAMTGKWYGLIMDIDKYKLTKKRRDAGQRIEILELKVVNQEVRQRLLGQPGFYPSYHMHRETWLTINLDDSVADEQIIQLLKVSRSFTIHHVQNGQPVDWLVPANPHYYDIQGHFSLHQETIWKQSKNVRVNDTVYLYVTAPVKAVMYRCQVTKINIPYRYTDQHIKMTKVMRLKVLTTYPSDFCPLTKLKEFGIKTVRGPRKLPALVVKYLNCK